MFLKRATSGVTEYSLGDQIKKVWGVGGGSVCSRDDKCKRSGFVFVRCPDRNLGRYTGCVLLLLVSGRYTGCVLLLLVSGRISRTVHGLCPVTSGVRTDIADGTRAVLLPPVSGHTCISRTGHQLSFTSVPRVVLLDIWISR